MSLSGTFLVCSCFPIVLINVPFHSQKFPTMINGYLIFEAYLKELEIFKPEKRKFLLTYEVCPESIQPCNMKNRDLYWRIYKVQETLYTGQWCLSPIQRRDIGTSHSSPTGHHLPHRIFLNLIDGLKSLPFERRFQVWGKPEAQGAKSGL